LSSIPFSSRIRITPIARAFHDRQRVHRFLAEHERVERIAVVAVGARDEAVVGGIVHRAVEHAIEPQQPGLLVQLVLVLAALSGFR
jgi:hypothetical protein